MFSQTFTAFLMRLLLANPSLAGQPLPGSPLAGIRSIELTAEPAGEVYRHPHTSGERPEGLTGLFDSGAMDEKGITTLDISKSITQGSRSALKARIAVSLRSARRVGLALELENRSAGPWTPREVVLLETGGEELEATVWPLEPIPPGGRRRVFIEAEATAAQATGKYVLKLSEDGPRAVTLGHIAFPRLEDKRE